MRSNSFNIRKSSRHPPHFIFISTIGVLGIKTERGTILSENSPYSPYNYYSSAKKLAEEYINVNFLGKPTILRPTAIYGQGAKGNFFNILNNTIKFPLPFKGIKAQKNYIYVENLVEIIYQSIINKPAGVFNCCDPWAVSVYDFRKEIANSKFIKLKDFYLPNFLIKCMLILLGKKDKIEYLFSDLRIDGDKIYQTLQLTPKYSLAEGIKKSFSSE
jgi:nucleoside-diphosphate-sugar epimerase